VELSLSPLAELHTLKQLASPGDIISWLKLRASHPVFTEQVNPDE
jgi:hypothetical protein